MLSTPELGLLAGCFSEKETEMADTRNLIQKMFGVSGDGATARTKAAIRAAEGEATPPQEPAFEGMGGSTVDPNATVVLPAGRRITPQSKAILDQMLKQREERMRQQRGR